MTEEPRPPAMLDVARLAGVSHQTVSRVLNNSDRVRPETADRVLRAIEELGYRRNLAARALATQKSGLIGILASGFPHMGPAATVGAIETAARAAGFSALVSVHADPGPSEVMDSMYAFVEHGVQGIAVVTPRRETAEVALAKAHGIPVVLVADLRGVDVPAHLVAVDQIQGARDATQLLLDGGARSIAHISGPTGWFDADRRVEGWQETLPASVRAHSALVVGDWSANRGYAAGRELIASGLPDAVFCANDLTALGLLKALRERGLRVPDDVQVVGFDDIPAAAFVSPGLTTVSQPLDALGTRCVQGLLAAIDGHSPGVEALRPTLVVRDSTLSV